MKQKFLSLQSLMVAVMCVIMSLGVTSCSDDEDVKVPENAIVGTWRLTLWEAESHKNWYCQHEYKSDGTLLFKSWYQDEQQPSSYEGNGKWTIDGNILYLEFNGASGVERENYRFSIEGDKLIIYDYDDPGPNEFYRIK